MAPQCDHLQMNVLREEQACVFMCCIGVLSDEFVRSISPCIPWSLLLYLEAATHSEEQTSRNTLETEHVKT